MKSLETQSKLINPWLANIDPYQPGLQKNNCIKLNTNENPYPYPTEIITQEFPNIEKLLARSHLYPDPVCQSLRDALASFLGVDASAIFIGNGSDDILSIIFRTLFSANAHLDSTQQICSSSPVYGYYDNLARMSNIHYQQLPLLSNWHVDFDALHESNAKLKILTLPNSPTGIIEEKQVLYNFIKQQKCFVLIDSAYEPFSKNRIIPDIFLEKMQNLLVCGTFSKAYSLAAMRVGWLVAAPKWIREFHKIRDPYNVNHLGQYLATKAIQNHKIFYQRISRIQENRKWLFESLRKLGFEVVDSQANYLFVKVPKKTNVSNPAKNLTQWLEQRNILIRYFEQSSCRDYVRISIGTRSHLKTLLIYIQDWLSR